MSSDIPGFYYDAVQRRYYRLTPQAVNAVPSARRINDRARQEQMVAKQLDSLNPRSTRSSRQPKERRHSTKSRLSLLRQRQYGQISSGN